MQCFCPENINGHLGKVEEITAQGHCVRLVKAVENVPAKRLGQYGAVFVLFCLVLTVAVFSSGTQGVL